MKTCNFMHVPRNPQARNETRMHTNTQAKLAAGQACRRRLWWTCQHQRSCLCLFVASSSGTCVHGISPVQQLVHQRLGASQAGCLVAPFLRHRLPPVLHGQSTQQRTATCMYVCLLGDSSCKRDMHACCGCVPCQVGTSLHTSCMAWHVQPASSKARQGACASQPAPQPRTHLSRQQRPQQHCTAGVVASLH